MGVPYLPGEAPLDHAALPALVLPVLDAIAADPRLGGARPVLELGRWLVAPAGWLLTRAIGAKRSRGKEIRTLDAGFNNHLAACGMMGSVLRRNWVFENLSNPAGPVRAQTLVGPLCTTIDRLAADAEMPEVRPGDVIAIPQSGAYGLTASPTRFISHPEPREVLMTAAGMVEVTESRANAWPETAP
jgi:diaminopimelate decarboxylase